MILSNDNFQSSSAEGHPLTVYFKLPVSEISEIDDHKSVSKHIIIQSFILKQKSSLLRLSLLTYQKLNLLISLSISENRQLLHDTGCSQLFLFIIF